MSTDNELVAANSYDDIMKMIRLTAMTTNRQAEQMGIVLEKIDSHDRSIMDMKGRIENVEHNLILTPAQRKRMPKAVKARVFSVLKITGEYHGRKFVPDSDCKHDYKTYYSEFVRLLYVDAKSCSKMGDPYADTLRVDYDEVMEYIEAWYPSQGVEGLKAAIDKSRSDGDVA